MFRSLLWAWAGYLGGEPFTRMLYRWLRSVPPQ
jgi:hypothetical protein